MHKRKRDEHSFFQYDTFVKGLMVITFLLAIFVLAKDALQDFPPDIDTSSVATADTDTLDNHTDCDMTTKMFMATAARGGEIHLDCNAVFIISDTITIDTDLTIRGSSDLLMSISGDHLLETMFRVTNGATLTLENIKIVDSSRYGIYLEEGTALYATNVRLSGHGSRESDGAAIWNNSGYVSIQQSVIENNHSYDDAAGIMNWRNGLVDIWTVSFRNNSAGTEADGTGAAIYNQGVMTIKESSFVENQTPNSTGAAIASLNGSITIENSEFMNNSTSDEGAAIYNGTESAMTLTDNTFTGNSANCENDGAVNDLSICPMPEE